MEKTVYQVQVIKPSESKNLNNLGVVEIYPNSKILQHRLGPPNIVPGSPGTSWTDLQAFKFKEKNLETVIEKHIDNENTALIIVHMQRDDYDKKILKTQAAALKAASLKEIPIYATFMHSARADGSALPKLPKTLQKQILMFSSENCFYGNSGNALYTKNEIPGKLLKDELFNSHIERAIVMGQDLGQCVDSTILGRFSPPNYGTFGPPNYEKGLLDLGIAVVTAKKVLGHRDARASSYFNFKLTPNRIEPDIELNLNTHPQQEEEEDFI